MKVLRRLLQNASGERGASAIMFMLLGTALFGFVAVAVDWGMLTHTRREMQNGVDSAALAGAASLPNNTAAARATAVAYAGSNSLPAGELTIAFEETYTANDTINVVALNPAVPTWFAQFLGISSEPVAAGASGIIGSVGSAECVVPIGLIDLDNDPNNGSFGYQFNVSYDIKLGSGANLTPGNFQGLNLYGNGGSGFRDGMAGQRCGDVTVYKGEEVPPEPGNMVGPARQGFSQRVGGDHCPISFTELIEIAGGVDNISLDDSVCLAYIPIVNEYDNGASQDVTVLGLAMIFLERWTDAPGGQAILTGRFVKPTDIGDWVPYDEYGTRTVRLLR